MIGLRVNDKHNQSYGGFQYPTSGEVEAPDWNPEPVCGQGLHFFKDGEGDGALIYDQTKDPEAIWLIVEADDQLAVDLDGKWKAPRLKILYSGFREEILKRLRSLVGPNKAIMYATKVVWNCEVAAAGYGGTVVSPSTAAAGDYGLAKVSRFNGSATVKDWGVAIAEDYGTATARGFGVALAGVRGQAEAGYVGRALVSHHGTAKTGDYGLSIARHHGVVVSGYEGVALAGYQGAAKTGDCGTAKVGDYGVATAGWKGRVSAGDYGKATVEDYGTAEAGIGGTAVAGNCGVASVEVGGSAAAGVGGVLLFRRFGGSIVCFPVDGERVKANQRYRLESSGFEGDHLVEVVCDEGCNEHK